MNMPCIQSELHKNTWFAKVDVEEPDSWPQLQWDELEGDYIPGLFDEHQCLDLTDALMAELAQITTATLVESLPRSLEVVITTNRG